MAPQVRSWVGGRDDMEEKSQGFATMRTSASWRNCSLDTIQDKRYAAEASIDQKSLQRLNSRKLDEVGEIAAQSDCIPGTTLGKGYGAEEKSTNREGSSKSNETSAIVYIILLNLAGGYKIRRYPVMYSGQAARFSFASSEVPRYATSELCRRMYQIQRSFPEE
ncbi:hypothetical protein ACMFMG_011775 [Clarireedia jacksonii]